MQDAVLCRASQENDVAVTYSAVTYSAVTYSAVTYSADMTLSEQCKIAASKGNQTTVTYREKQVIVILYKATFRPHFEYFI